MKGYTLIELLVTIAAISILGWGLYHMVAGGIRGCQGHGQSIESPVR